MYLSTEKEPETAKGRGDEGMLSIKKNQLCFMKHFHASTSNDEKYWYARLYRAVVQMNGSYDDHAHGYDDCKTASNSAANCPNQQQYQLSQKVD